MNYKEAFKLFERMIATAEEELYSFTKSTSLSTERKADKSIVTACDKQICNFL